MMTRRIPRTHWVRFAFVWRGCQPGHHWMYYNSVRRDTFTLFGCGFVLVWMPTKYREPNLPYVMDDHE